MPKVSIIMNCLNGERYLSEAIESVYQQSYRDWEIIFVDNASTDGSAQIAKSYDARVKYYNTQQTIPLYAARNFGLQFVTGDYVAFLDVDDHWHVDKLSKQIEIMDRYASVYLVCSGYFRQNEQLGTTTRFKSYRSKFLNFANALDEYPITLSSVMLRFNQISKTLIQFEPSLNLTGDYELFIKIIYRFKAYFIADPLVTLRVHTTNLSAKLVRDWPKELEQTHLRLTQELSPSVYEKKLMDKRYVKTCSLVSLANNDNKKARQFAQKYLFKDAKISLIYFFTFHSRLVKWLVKVRGFS